MARTVSTLLTALPLTLVPVATHANLLLDGSFESPSVAGTARGWCNLNPFADPDLTSCMAQGVEPTLGTFGPWVGNLTTYVSTSNDDWGLNGPVADGSQFGILQARSSWVQTVNIVAPGSYLLTWSDAGRIESPGAFGSDQNYWVRLDGVTLASYWTSSGQPFTPHQMILQLTAGSHNLRFSGQPLPGDQSAYVDAISLTPVPEPSTTVLLAAGLAVAIAAVPRLRRSR